MYAPMEMQCNSLGMNGTPYDSVLERVCIKFKKYTKGGCIVPVLKCHETEFDGTRNVQLVYKAKVS